MTNTSKILLGAGAIILTGGIIYAIYAKNKTRAEIAEKIRQEGTGGPNPKGNDNINKINDAVKKTTDIVKAAQAYAKEAWPLKLGMVGPNTRQMQTALRDKFNHLDLNVNGIYDFKTLGILNKLGYTTLLDNEIDQADFNAILNGVKKT